MTPSHTSRSFTWSDIPALHALAARRTAADGPRAKVRIGDFYWVLRNTPADDPLRHMRVWPRDDGALDAAAWLDPPDIADAIIAPDAGASMLGEALDWLEAEHAGVSSGALSIVVVDGDAAREEALRARGYARTDAGNVRFSRALDAAPAPSPLPSGFAIRSANTDGDIERRVAVEAAAFGSTTLTANAWRAATGRLPDYRTDLDIVAVATDGTGASACTLWYDEVSRCGELEAVGTAPAFRRMGVCKAVIIEGLRRLHALGATQAAVETTLGNVAAIALYTSCGFAVVAEDYAWSSPSR